jgi:hypothetical protein
MANARCQGRCEWSCHIPYAIFLYDFTIPMDKLLSLKSGSTQCMIEQGITDAKNRICWHFKG